ncbi:MAG: FtsQ-type POTRA domain-containing protein [Treponemataceae bacterium]|nr:MAG: FtsQ-type POTRA domain-containing protein [Treponemataceae bacterium]
MTGYVQSSSNVDKQALLKMLVKILAIILGAVLIFQGVIYIVAVPFLKGAKISYLGCVRYTPSDLNNMLGEQARYSWIKFNANAAASRLLTLPGIASVDVNKTFPDSISIRITERAPVALTLLNRDGYSIPAFVDEYGVVFFSTAPSANGETEATGTGMINSFPLVTGLPIEQVNSEIHVPRNFRPLLEQMSDLHEAPQKYFQAFSEIHVVQKEYGNYELVLYPVKSKKRVLMDRGLNEYALQYIMVALDVIDSVDPDASELDLRYGAISYR